MSSIKEVSEEFFPKKKKRSEVKPYKFVEYDTLPGSNTNEIKLPYNKEGFEKPPEDNILSAFTGFYNSKLNKGENGDTNESQSGRIEMMIPQQNPKITIGLNKEKEYIYFRYKDGDNESKEVIDAFIQKLMK